MKNRPVSSAIAICLLLGVSAAPTITHPQSLPVDHFTQAQLLEKAGEINTDASGQAGAASRRLQEYPNHFTMIAVRTKSGNAEIHENFADFFYILKGSATLISGGKLIGAAPIGPGEIKGTSVEGGTQEALASGDIVHIPAGVSHQLILPHGGSLTYFVIKVKEK